MLIAQTTALDSSPAASGIAIAATAATLLIGLMLFIVLLLRHFRASRQLLHTERMRSIEAGFPLESPEPNKIQLQYMHNAFWISFWIVFGVPAAAFSAATKATAEIERNLGLGLVIWIGAAAASVAAVVCATVLMIHSRTRRVEDVGDTSGTPPKRM